MTNQASDSPPVAIAAKPRRTGDGLRSLEHVQRARAKLVLGSTGRTGHLVPGFSHLRTLKGTLML